jgi:hypothetical protein
MPLFFKKMLLFRLFKLILRFLASLASAVVLVSGYLFFLSLSSGSEESEGSDDAADSEAEDDAESQDEA